ncbi:MAG TPA: TIGR02757 family protein [Thermoanaerobaculia bacterium]|nr:TIGR02757 family protein [Thermoanaerobaculia bacterium]
MRTRPVRRELLKERLNALVATFDVSTITPDPLQLVLRYEGPEDQEIAALLAAAFAYGRADIVVANIGRVLERMGPSPHLSLMAFDRDEAVERFAGFSHRFQKTPELVALLERLAAAVRQYGTIGRLFESCYDADDEDIGPSLTRFVAALINIVPPSHVERAALDYLLTSPANGSACKRMNLFLRWMVRRTSPDLGLWRFADPSKLVMPLDTHVHRIASFLGLNRRKSADWKTARQLTDRLAVFDAGDPVRYDFAICRLGILDLCSRKRRKEQCDVCMVRDVCRFPCP